jgi:hypothetical protein
VAAAATQAPSRSLPRSPTAAPANRRPTAFPGGRITIDEPNHGARRWVVGLLSAAVLIAVVVVLLVITGSGGTHKKTSAGNAAGKHRVAAFNTSAVTVSVLNGTAASGLAHRVALKLGGAGYKEGMIATATDQTHTSTVVAYLPGFKRDALAVAGTLKLKPASVEPVDQSTQAVACPPPAACTANVVVTVGTDLANTA